MTYVMKEEGTEIYKNDDFTIYIHNWDRVGQCVAMTPVQTFSVYIRKLGITVMVKGARSQYKARQMCLEIGEVYSVKGIKELEHFLKLEKEWTKNHTGVITQFAELADLRKENTELMNLVEEAYGNGFKDGHYGGRIGANITSSKLDKIREPLTVDNKGTSHEQI